MSSDASQKAPIDASQTEPYPAPTPLDAISANNPTDIADPNVKTPPPPNPWTPPSSATKKKLTAAVTLDGILNDAGILTKKGKAGIKSQGPSKRSPKNKRNRFKPRAGEKKATPSAASGRRTVTLNTTSKVRKREERSDERRKAGRRAIQCHN